VAEGRLKAGVFRKAESDMADAREMQQVRNDPNAVFFYAFVQARAIAY
jgi:hypothetical protein